MADWRQIQARIRKAKNSPDAASKLSELYQRTRDAMVAWELGTFEEKAGHNDEAGRWYMISVQRFRRSDWKKKAEEALTRLGLELPAPGADVTPPPRSPSQSHAAAPAETSNTADSQSPGPSDEELSDTPQHEEESAPPDANGFIAVNTNSTENTSADGMKKKRRRGRRGGRGRRRKGAAATPDLPSKSFADANTPGEKAHTSAHARSEESESQRETPRLEKSVARTSSAPARSDSNSEDAPSRPVFSSRTSTPDRPAPMLPSERVAHGRAGDPALASRLSRLESMLRRLVSSPLHSIDQADEAPAGPGVFLLSDSDQITSYYVEACQTLRVGIGNLARGSRAGKNPRGGGKGYPDTSGMKSKLAEHLEISETKVSQYLKDHCVIRWIQLDDDAPLLAHFAIAVLRTPLNMD